MFCPTSDLAHITKAVYDLVDYEIVLNIIQSSRDLHALIALVYMISVIRDNVQILKIFS